MADNDDRRSNERKRSRLKSSLKRELAKRRAYGKLKSSIDRSRDKSLVSRSKDSLYQAQILLRSNIVLARAHARVRSENSRYKDQIRGLTTELMELKMNHNHLLHGDIEQEVQKRLKVEKREYVRLLSISRNKVGEGLQILGELHDFLAGRASTASSGKPSTSCGHPSSLRKRISGVVQDENRAACSSIQEEEEEEDIANITFLHTNLPHGATKSRNPFDLTAIFENESFLDASVQQDWREMVRLSKSDEEIKPDSPLRSTVEVVPDQPMPPSESQPRPLAALEQLEFDKESRRLTFVVTQSKQTAPLSPVFRRCIHRSPAKPAPIAVSMNHVHNETVLTPMDMEISDVFAFDISSRVADVVPQAPPEVAASAHVDKVEDGYVDKCRETVTIRPSSSSPGNEALMSEEMPHAELVPQLIEAAPSGEPEANSLLRNIEIDKENERCEIAASAVVDKQPTPDAEVSFVPEANNEEAATKAMQKILNCSENARLDAKSTDEEATPETSSKKVTKTMRVSFSNILECKIDDRGEFTVPSTSGENAACYGGTRPKSGLNRMQRKSARVSKTKRQSQTPLLVPSEGKTPCRSPQPSRILSPMNRMSDMPISPNKPEVLPPKPKANKTKRFKMSKNIVTGCSSEEAPDPVENALKGKEITKQGLAETVGVTNCENDVSGRSRRQRKNPSYKEVPLNVKLRR